MEKQQIPLEKYLDEKYPIPDEKKYSSLHNSRLHVDRQIIFSKREIATEAYEFALQQPLPPAPEIETLLNEKFPIPERIDYGFGEGEDYERSKSFSETMRKTFAEGYLLGRSSLKQECVNCDNKIPEDKGVVCTRCFIDNLPKEKDKQGTPTDEEIEKYFKSGLPHPSVIAFENGQVNGAKWMRDTYASKQEIDWDRLEKEFHEKHVDNEYIDFYSVDKVFEFFKSQLSEEKKDV